MYLSILIRNLNESKNLQRTLTALRRQVTDFEYEVIVLDNESDDDSKQIAEEKGCKVFSLKRDAFTYGHALNYGISKCNGEIILVLSSHVILLNEYFLENIPEYFKEQNVAALRFVQASFPFDAADSIENGPRQLRHSNHKDFGWNNWDNFMVNHCAALRRQCWQLQPFDENIFSSEDKLWSLEILKKGFTILYNVPCFYVYYKPFSRDHKIYKQVIDVAAKEMITGQSAKLFKGPYLVSISKFVVSELRRLRVQTNIHHKVFNGLRKFKKQHQAFIQKN